MLRDARVAHGLRYVHTVLLRAVDEKCNPVRLRWPSMQRNNVGSEGSSYRCQRKNLDCPQAGKLRVVNIS